MGVKPIPEGYNNVIPYLICKDTAKVIEFAEKTFGAKLTEISKAEEGKIYHATIHIHDSAVMLSESSQKWPALSAMLYIYVDDVDMVYKKGLDAGGESLREPTNEFYGDRVCALKDSSGNQWWIGSHIEDVSPEEIAKRMKQNK